MSRLLPLVCAAMAAAPLSAQQADPCVDPVRVGAPVLGAAQHRQQRIGRAGTDLSAGYAGVLRTADLGERASGCLTGFSVGLAPMTLRVVGNSTWAVDRYEGSLWAGRGISTLFTAGIDLRGGPLRLRIAPEVTYQQNQHFATVPAPDRSLGEFAYPWYGAVIDWPSRHGSRPFTDVHPGASRLGLSWRGAEIGFSGENLWFGPAIRYPLLLSNAGPGIPHLYLRAPRVGVGIGTLEAQLFLGRLSESAYFDADRSNDYRSLSGFSLLLRPSEDLALGAGILRHRSSGRVPPLRDAVAFAKLPFAFLRGRDDDDNGLMSLFAVWNHPASGLGLHVEWGREDFFYDLNELLTNPNHAHGYTLGLTKSGEWRDRRVLLALELTQLGADGSWYVNGDVPQGHTHRGQLLGAYVGPGSEAQYASIDVIDAKGERWTAYLERVRWDDFIYRAVWQPRIGFLGHDVEIRGGVGHARRLGALVLDASGGVSFRRNRAFLGVELWEFDWERNLELDLALSWP